MKIFKITMSIILLGFGIYLLKTGNDFNTKKMFYPMAGMGEDGSWYSNGMTIKEYKQYIDSFLVKFDDIYGYQLNTSLSDRAMDKLKKAKANQNYYQIGGSFLILIALVLFFSDWLKKVISANENNV